MTTAQTTDQTVLVSSADFRNDQTRYILYKREKEFAKFSKVGQSQSIFQEKLIADDQIKRNSGNDVENFMVLRSVKVKKLIHEGIFGRVFKADLRGKPIALKVINAATSKYFMQERNILLKCSHKRIIKILAAILDFELMSPVLVLEYCHCSLKQIYADPVSSHDSARYLVQITEGIEYLHNKNIVHLDIKPENLLLKTDGNAVIGDFGFAMQLEKATDELKIHVIGTPGYIDYNGLLHGTFNKASDIFSLGCVFVEFWTLQKYIVCSPAVVDAFKAETGNNVLNFYKQVYLKGRPRNTNLNSRQQLNDRLKELFSYQDPNKKFMLEICTNMLDNDSTKRPNAAEILNSPAVIMLKNNFCTEDVEKWTIPSVSNELQSIEITHKYSANDLQKSTFRILNSFGFSKISTIFFTYFELEKCTSVKNDAEDLVYPDLGITMQNEQRKTACNRVEINSLPDQHLVIGNNLEAIQSQQTASSSKCSTKIYIDDLPGKSLSTFLTNLHTTHMVGATGTLFKAVNYSLCPDQAVEIIWEPITDIAESNLVLSSVQQPTDSSKQAVSIDHPASSSSNTIQAETSSSRQQLASTSQQQIGTSETNSNHSKAQNKIHGKGRPKKSYNDLPGIHYDGTFNTCTVCGQLKTPIREKARRHRRTHIALGEL